MKMESNMSMNFREKIPPTWHPVLLSMYSTHVLTYPDCERHDAMVYNVQGGQMIELFAHQEENGVQHVHEFGEKIPPTWHPVLLSTYCTHVLTYPDCERHDAMVYNV
jgi:hypothetical protein